VSSALSGPPAILPDIAVVIVAYNSAHVIGDLLDSLPAALDGLTADVVVVDNGSSDGTAELVAALGACRIVRSANVGYAAGINRGVREAAPAQAILVLNPDVRLHPGSLPPLLAALAEPRVGIAAPRVLTPQGKLHLSLRREPTLPRALGLTRTRLGVFSEYVYDPSAYTRPCTVDWALGAALITSRECYEALGGWDETYFLPVAAGTGRRPAHPVRAAGSRGPHRRGVGPKPPDARHADRQPSPVVPAPPRRARVLGLLLARRGQPDVKSGARAA
jgi:GT2 family glycosyltransferase